MILREKGFIIRRYIGSYCIYVIVNDYQFLNTVVSILIRAGRYDGVIVIPQYVSSPIPIPKFILLYNFIMIVNNYINNN